MATDLARFSGATTSDTDRITINKVAAHGLTVEDVARRYRVSPDKVRAWIRAGELKAINTSTAKCGRPRFVIVPESLCEFEKKRAAAEPPKPVRQKRRPAAVDYFP